MLTFYAKGLPFPIFFNFFNFSPFPSNILKRCINRGFGIFYFFMWKIQTLKSVKVLLKYGLILPTYQIKIDLCYRSDTNAIHKANLSDTKTSYYIIFKTH